MPYVAMAELKWSIPGRKGSLVVPAGDEVGGPVPPRAIQRGVVAFLPNVSGRTWDERMAEEFPKELPPETEVADAPPGYVKHGDELIKAPRTAQKLSEPKPKPPTTAEVLKAGYSVEAAEGIVAEEQEKAAKGHPPYGDNEPPSPELPKVDPGEAAALGLLPDDAPEPQETTEGDEEKPGLLDRIFGGGGKTEVAGPGVEGQVPAGPEAPAPASDEAPEPASGKSHKSKGRGSRKKG